MKGMAQCTEKPTTNINGLYDIHLKVPQKDHKFSTWFSVFGVTSRPECSIISRISGSVSAAVCVLI